MTELVAGGFRRLAFCLLIMSVLAATASAQAQTDAKDRVLPAPRSSLSPVHLPDLKSLEPDVREQLSSLQDSMAAVAKNREVTAPRLAEAYGEMGQVYQAYSLLSPAEECYLNAHTLEPNDFRWVYFLGSVCQRQTRTEEAIKYYKNVRELRPDYLPAAINLGDLDLQQNRPDEAQASFEATLKIDPTSAAALYGLGQVALSKKNYPDAVKYLEQALKAAPEATRINYALGMAYRGMGEIDKAEAVLARRGPVGVRASDPLIDGLQNLIRGERIHILRGRMAFEAHRFNEAADEFRKAVAASPDSVTARVNLGSVLAQLGHDKEATEQFEAAIKVDPEDAAAHYNLGLLLSAQGRHEQAVTHLESAVKSNPKDTDARFLLAGELLKVGQPDEALADYSTVVEADPSNEGALLQMATLLENKKEYAKALDAVEKANKMFPQRGRTAILLAYLLAASPQYDLRDGKRALDLANEVYHSTGSVNHGAVVAMALAELGQCDKAAELERKLISAAEQRHETGLVEKLKGELQRYEKGAPCRPRGEPQDGPGHSASQQHKND